jgi:hypothetical protein
MRHASNVTRLRKITGVQSALLVGEANPKLLDRLREALLSRHYSRRIDQTYCHWVKLFIYFHNIRHPADMAEPQINGFLTHLAVKEKISASSQNQALSALLFLYRHFIGREVGDLGEVIRARKPKHLPVVRASEEGSPGFRTGCLRACKGSVTARGSGASCDINARDVAFRISLLCMHSEEGFRGSMADLGGPLSTLPHPFRVVEA